MDIDQLAMAEVKLGIELEQFLNSETGQYLHGRAAADLHDAWVELEKVDPTDPEAIRKTQNKAWVARNFLAWMAEAISNGRNAEQRLQQEDE